MAQPAATRAKATAQSCPLATPVVTYAYDSGTNAIGHLTSLTDQAGTASYAYDILGRPAAETRTIAGVSKSTSYGYNLDGSVKTLTYPSGRIVTYTPDSAGRLVSAVDGNGTSYVTSASYNPDNSLKSLLNGSTPALNQSFQYTPRLQLCRITVLTSGTLPTSCGDTNIGNVMDRGYNFNYGAGDNGNVMAIINYRDASRSQSFTYDPLNRLTSGWSSANTGAYSWGENYSIDAWGNLQISPMGGKAHGGTFQLSGNAQNRPTGMAYDAAGNLMSYLSSTYTYDQENRLSSTAGTTYTYDGNGERVLKSNTSTGAPVKRYWSMGGNTLAEADGSGNLTAEYIYFGSKRVARIDLPANTVHYYLSDHLGSTSIVVSAAGTIEEESDYYPFGTEVIVTGQGANELKFAGKRRDTESQLDYFGARSYSNAFGRFLTPDWAAKPAAVPYADFGDPQSLNLYGYVRNNPIMRFDLDGHQDDKTPWQRFSSAMKNLLSFKTESGVGVKIGGAIAGVKVSGGSGISTEVKTYPLGDHPTEITSKAESSVQVKIGTGSAELKSSAQMDPKTGALSTNADANVGVQHSEHTASSISTDHEISLIGGTLELGPVGGAAEIVVNTDQLSGAAHSFLPAVGQGFQYLLGLTGGGSQDGQGGGGKGTNPFPGFKSPTPDGQ
jgi:RHS repeat-associated protein